MLNQKIHIQAVEAIPAYGCITSSGKLANSSDPTSENRIVGVSEGSVAAGAWGDATVTGLLFNKDWTWTPGAVLYLNGTVLSETAPGSGFIQQIGMILTPQSVFINIQSSGGNVKTIP